MRWRHLRWLLAPESLPPEIPPPLQPPRMYSCNCMQLRHSWCGPQRLPKRRPRRAGCYLPEDLLLGLCKPRHRAACHFELPPNPEGPLGTFAVTAVPN